MASCIVRMVGEKAAAGRRLLLLSQNRSCSKLSSGDSPWLMLPEEGGGTSYSFYSPGQDKVVKHCKQDVVGASLVGSSHGWVAMQNGGRHLFVWNPITGAHVKLPSLSEHARRVDKVILSCPPDSDSNCCAVMSFDDGVLALCRPGRSTAWTIPIGERIPYEDFVYSRRDKQLICLVDAEKIHHDGDDLEGWDVTDPSSPRIDWSVKLSRLEHHPEYYPEPYTTQRDLVSSSIWCNSRRYLLRTRSDRLLLVTRHIAEQVAPDGSVTEDWNAIYPSKTFAFDVHVIDRRRRRLCYMEESLDGLAVFVGLNQSLAVPAADFPGLRPDCVYFTDSNVHEWYNKSGIYGGHDIGIFDYKKRTLSSCYYPLDYGSLKRIHPTPLWFTPTPHY